MFKFQNYQINFLLQICFSEFNANKIVIAAVVSVLVSVLISVAITLLILRLCYRKCLRDTPRNKKDISNVTSAVPQNDSAVDENELSLHDICMAYKESEAKRNMEYQELGERETDNDPNSYEAIKTYN